MNEALIRPLSELGLADTHDVGGKAASLGELLAAGVHVPDGVVLSARAGALTPEQRSSLLQGIEDTLDAGPFAVRSSAIAEDGAERSFAGMFETVLDVSAAHLPTAVERVLASAHADRISAYQREAAVGMAVIVQRMISPAAAGVALTADPVSGDRRSCVISAVEGVGERLVSGAAIGDEWIVDDDGAEARRRPEAAIDRGQAIAIAKEARRTAAARRVPQDVEWAIDA
jgi:phosphoenolpyruvate synthase/pyruvate phosphate dikinase